MEDLQARYQDIVRNVPLGPYRRLEAGPVEDVGPNDFLSVKEVIHETNRYLEAIDLRASISLLWREKHSALHWAAFTGNMVHAKGLTSLDTKDPRLEINHGDFNGRSPLSYAAEAGNKAIVELLLNDCLLYTSPSPRDS